MTLGGTLVRPRYMVGLRGGTRNLWCRHTARSASQAWESGLAVFFHLTGFRRVIRVLCHMARNPGTENADPVEGVIAHSVPPKPLHSGHRNPI